MSFTDITIAQRSADYTNITDSQAKMLSLTKYGDAILEISAATAEFIVQNLSLANGKPVIVSTGGASFLAGDYTAPKLQCSLVRIVEAQSSASEE